MKIHELKTLVKYYNKSFEGIKNFEIRKNDRDFQIGDFIVLRPYHPNCEYNKDSGIIFEIIYILDDFEGLADGYVGLGLKFIKNN